MKHIFRILLFSSVSLFGLAPLHAQWERIGWEGGKVTIAAQLGNTLYAKAKYSYYRSTDWGKTWTFFHYGLPNDTLYNTTLHVFKEYLIADPYFDNNVNNYSGPIQFGFYFCKEGDEKWTFKPLTQFSCNAPTQIFYFSGDSIVVYGGCNNNYDIGYFFSKDGGLTWERRMQGINIPVNQSVFQPFATGSNFFCQLNSRLYRTSDFGLTWDSLFFPNNIWPKENEIIDRSYGYSLNDSILFQYYFFSSNFLLSGLFRSTDKGTTWIRAEFDGEYPVLLYLSGIRKIGKKTFLSYNRSSTNSHKEYESDDLGIHWKEIPSLDSIVTWDIFGKDNTYVLSTSKVNSYVYEYYTTDSTFTTLAPLVSSEKGIYTNSRTVVGAIGKNLFALPDARKHEFYDSIMISTDNGSSWEQKPFFQNNHLNYHRWVTDGEDLYAFGLDHFYSPCLFRSTDEGMTWSIPISFASKDRISQLFIQHDTMVVVRSTDFLLSIDKGRSWIVSSPEISDGIDMSYRNGILALFNTATGYLSLSTNFGESWMMQHPFQNGGNYGSYVFGDRIFTYFNSTFHTYRLYYRTASNPTWLGSLGLPLYNGMATFPNCDDGSIMYTTCTDFGNNTNGTAYTALYYSEDSGSNWKQLGDYVTNSPDVFIGSDYLFLAGPTELWRGPKPTNTSSVAKTKGISSISINDCYPNPAASEMRISYSIPKRSNIGLSVFDMTGKEIATIASEDRDAGSYEVQWDSRTLPNGSYILKLTACRESVTKVVEVIK